MSRITQVHRILRQKHLDTTIILSDCNRRYLSGFTDTSGALIIPKDKQYLVTDFRYTDQAAKQAPNYEIINHKFTIIDEIKESLHQENFENVDFEEHHVSYDTYLELNKNRISLISISNTVDKIRDVKDADEVALIRKTANIVDEAYGYILTVVKTGMTERELKAILGSRMLELGAGGPSFDTIVASDHKGALPHDVASDKIIEKDDMITLDFGAYYNGYCSDITRTFATGEPDPKLREIYQVVLESRMKTISKIRPGMTGTEVDAISRNYLKSKGYGKGFGYSLGHGIGLEIHEGPMLARTIQDKLQVNSCVTVEPGVYIGGSGGIKIEDDILITENGCQVFTKCTGDLIVLT